jgi:hypothetical protein
LESWERKNNKFQSATIVAVGAMASVWNNERVRVAKRAMPALAGDL